MNADAQLLFAYAETRDECAFAELVRRHLDGVYSAALRRVGGDRHLAEDVSQRVFVVLSQQARALSSHPFLTGWLYNVTRNVAVNTARAERRRKEREKEFQFMHDILSSSEPEADWSQVKPILDQVMDQLSDCDRKAILLRFVERRSFAELGTYLRLSEDAARMRVDRAIEKLRRLLERRGISSSAAALGIALTNHAVLAAPAGFAAVVTQAAMNSAFVSMTPMAAALKFMMTSKITTGLVGVALLAVGLSTVVHEIHASSDAEMSLETDAANYQELLRKINDLKERARMANTESAFLEKKIADLQTAQIASAQQVSAASPQAKGDALMARHPEVKEAFSHLQDARNRFRYDALIRSLALTPARIERFLELRREGAAYGAEIDPLSHEYIKIAAGTGMPLDQVKRELVDLLGESGYGEYRNFTATLPARDLVVQVGTDLSFSDSPLLPEQTEPLIKIISNNRERGTSGGTVEFDWTKIIDQAQSVLSETQLSALRGIQARANYQQALNAFAATVSK